MNVRAMLAVADRYASLLDEHGAIVRAATPNQSLELPFDRQAALNHARWQVEMARTVVNRLGGVPTAIRLIGTAQGLLVASGVLTVEEMWRDNEELLDSASIRAFYTAKDELERGRVTK